MPTLPVTPTPEPTQVKLPPPKPKIKSALPRFAEWIDVEMVNAVIDEGNGLELLWLMELLKDGVKVRNTTGRFLKADRFMQAVEERQKAAMPYAPRDSDEDITNPTFVPS